MAAEAITMVSTGLVFVSLGGVPGAIAFESIAKPLVGAISTYFVVNTSLIGGAIALSSSRTWWQVWHDEFLWIAPSFMVAGSAGALAALIIQRGRTWEALLLFAPVYLTYRTYRIFVDRFDDQRRHVEETQRLHTETLEALRQALNAEQALVEHTLTHVANESIRMLPVPVIARINGWCLGFGMELAAACDMRVGVDTAKFGMPEVRVGIPSGMEANLLPALIGWGKTAELIFTGDIIDAAEAYRCGFLQKLVAVTELDAAVEKMVSSILLAGPRAIRLQKPLMRD